MPCIPSACVRLTYMYMYMYFIFRGQGYQYSNYSSVQLDVIMIQLDYSVYHRPNWPAVYLHVCSKIVLLLLLILMAWQVGLLF